MEQNYMKQSITKQSPWELFFLMEEMKQTPIAQT